MEPSELTERLLAAAGDRTYRSIADLTSTNAETVRRYMQGQAPSVEFLASLCSALGISEQWLISGRGPMRVNQLKTHALKDASPSELLSAMAGTIERIADRVDRLEVFITTLETRLRVRALPASIHSRGTGRVPPSTTLTESSDGSGHASADLHSSNAGRIAGALAQRPRPDAG
ncbi:MAG: hypothetical protein AB7G11_09025 [Phycisphaerales bacterium]